ncbi:MAG: hypothetical protein V2A79_17640 [Planctomycetota bacterium]
MQKQWTWWPVLGLGLLGASSICPAGGMDACSQASSSASTACWHQAMADYWIAVGKCSNLSSTEERRACKRQTVQARQSALEECQEQFEAREEVCDELGPAPYDPVIDPADFVSVIDNPYFPLTPGTTFIYEGASAQGTEHVEVVVTHTIREILGVTCVEVHDTVSVNGDLIEDTLDWYAQDQDGNVWYFGENAKQFAGGLIVSLAGSWTAGVDGAKPGIIMPAQPQVDDLYRQEFFLGEAEDLAEVLSRTESVTVPFGVFANCLETKDFSPLEPGAIEHKYYASGVGQLLTVDVGTGARSELVNITHE